MIIVGLTGSIGMGKSTTAAMFREEGVPVYDADAAVHALYAQDGKGVEPIRRLVPGAVKTDTVDRDVLRKAVFENETLLKKIEEVIHPLLAESRQDFLKENKEVPIVLLDIPLLFETGGDANVDKIVVVTASPEVQRERVLARHDMDEDRFLAILAKQVPDEEKRQRADFIVNTENGLDNARRQVAEILSMLKTEK